MSTQSDDAGQPFQSDSGPVPTQFDELKLVESGGNLGSLPGSICDVASPTTFIVERAPQTLTWNYCGQAGPRSENRTLSASDFASVEAALSQVAISHQSRCGADSATITLDLRNSSGLSLYADDFYSGCPWGDLIGRTFVTGLQGLSDAIRQLTPN